MATIAELAEDRTVEGVYAVTRKERRRTRAGDPYLALELADASGRIEARVWSDVELNDRRFGEGDAVRVLGRVERYGGKLQVQVRAVEAVEDADPAELTPSLRRDPDELDGFFDFLAGEIAHHGLAGLVHSFVQDAELRAALRSLPAAGAGGYHLVERASGRFARAVRVAGAFDGASVRATISEGELRIRLPKLVDRRGQATAVPVTRPANSSGS